MGEFMDERADDRRRAEAMSAVLGESVWHERLRRRLDPDTIDGQLRDLGHELLAIPSAAPGRHACADGQWRPTPPERCPEEFKQRERRRVLDEIGTLVGIGPMP